MNKDVFQTIETLARFDESQRAEFCRVLTERYPEINDDIYTRLHHEYMDQVSIEKDLKHLRINDIANGY